MKHITTYINEDASNESNIGKKIDNVFKKNPNKLTKIIQARQDNWDMNSTPWAREPMFLVADAKDDLVVGTDRMYSWIRWKNMKGKKDEVKGTFRNYDVSDGTGKPNSVIGIYYDRHFQLITSLDLFEKIYDIIDKDYEKYYHNLYENEN